MKITIGSGKGGTGKTTLAVSFALALEQNKIKVAYLDCDVEEPNGHLFFKPNNLDECEVSVKVPVVNLDKCTQCGGCAKFCAYNALAVLPGKVLVFNEMCHNCGGCLIVCPEDAISEKSRKIGVIRTGTHDGIELCYGELNVGEAQATPLIRAVKAHAREGAANILDAPPGTACPFVESAKDCDYCILVTEPTPFGLFDLKLAVDVIKVLKKPFGVVVNRVGIGDSRVEEFCKKNKIPILMRIAQDMDVAKAYSKGIPLLKVKPELAGKFIEMYKEIHETVGSDKR